MKTDLVMWTKNGAKTLYPVLKRIGEVIPKEVIGNRIIVDDMSSDNTREIAEQFGWKVIRNEGTGISDGANTALKNVENDFFCSFEQDLLLAWDWWLRVSPLLNDPKTAVASGIRFASKPQSINKLQRYVASKYRGEDKPSSWLGNRDKRAFSFGKTLDNTMYRTCVLRSVGGFPKMGANASVDTVLAYKIQGAGHFWMVDYNAQSTHLRSGLKEELQHQYWYGTQLQEIWRRIREDNNALKSPINGLSILSRLFIAPFTGVFIAFKTREPAIIYVYPLLRFYYTRGLLKPR